MAEKVDTLTLERLAALLDRTIASGRTLTYQDVAQTLELEAPHVVHQTAELLERLMELDAARGAPLRAAVVISKVRNGRPAPGFFEKARALGLFDGNDPAAFHARQLQALNPVWMRSEPV